MIVIMHVMIIQQMSFTVGKCIKTYKLFHKIVQLHNFFRKQNFKLLGKNWKNEFKSNIQAKGGN